MCTSSNNKIVTCPVCGSANTNIVVQPELVPGRGAQTLIDCRDCGNTVTVGTVLSKYEIDDYMLAVKDRSAKGA